MTMMRKKKDQSGGQVAGAPGAQGRKESELTTDSS